MFLQKNTDKGCPKINARLELNIYIMIYVTPTTVRNELKSDSIRLY